MTDFIDDLIRIVGKLRKHRSFWLWADKPTMERGAVYELLNSMHQDGDMRYSNLRSVSDDWPDCEVDDASGNTVGVEVTELVNKEAVERAQRDEMDFSRWTNDEIVEQVTKILLKKDQRSSHGGLYRKVVLVIHTDELGRSRLPVIENAQFPRLQNINEAFIIVSYDPEIKAYPWCEIPLG